MDDSSFAKLLMYPELHREGLFPRQGSETCQKARAGAEFAQKRSMVTRLRELRSQGQEWRTMSVKIPKNRCCF